jgi:hypothetical protein
MDNKWFDSDGFLIKPLPKEAINDCHHPGPCDSDVESWQEELDFMADRDQMINYLKPYGAWDDEELAAKTDQELAQIVLWLAAGAEQDGDEWLGLVH